MTLITLQEMIKVGQCRFFYQLLRHGVTFEMLQHYVIQPTAKWFPVSSVTECVTFIVISETDIIECFQYLCPIVVFPLSLQQQEKNHVPVQLVIRINRSASYGSYLKTSSRQLQQQQQLMVAARYTMGGVISLMTTQTAARVVAPVCTPPLNSLSWLNHRKPPAPVHSQST